MRPLRPRRAPRRRSQRFHVEAELLQRAHHKGAAGKLVPEARMIANALARGDHLAVAVDLLAQALGTVECGASIGEKFAAGHVAKIVFEQHAVPQALAMVTERSRRVVAGGGVSDQLQRRSILISSACLLVPMNCVIATKIYRPAISFRDGGTFSDRPHPQFVRSPPLGEPRGRLVNSASSFHLVPASPGRNVAIGSKPDMAELGQPDALWGNRGRVSALPL